MSSGVRSASSASSVAGARTRRIAAAVDHLLDLGEELDLADSAAAALQVVAGPKPRTLREMVADPGGNLPDLLDHPEVERAAPDERLDRLEEMLRPARCRRRQTRARMKAARSHGSAEDS